MPVTAGKLTWSCDNFATCGTPDVVSDGLPPGWSDNQFNGTRTILCQVDTPQLITAFPSTPTALASAAAAQAVNQAKVG
jgi:hypothetical protein